MHLFQDAQTVYKEPFRQKPETALLHKMHEYTPKNAGDKTVKKPIVCFFFCIGKYSFNGFTSHFIEYFLIPQFF